MTLAINDYIVWLQVSKYNIPLMKGLQGQKNFLCKLFCLFFSKLPLNLKILAQIPSRTVVSYKKEVLFCLKRIPKLNYKRMLAHDAHNIPFCHSIFPKILLFDPFLLQHFHRKQLFV